MTTFVGDPLYRPFKKADGEGDLVKNPGNEARDFQWETYKKGALLWFEKDHATGAEYLKKSGESLQSGLILEGLGLLQISAGNRAAAHEAFQRARNFYHQNNDSIRTLIYEVCFLKETGKKTDALKLTRDGIKFYPKASAIAVLRALEAEMAPPLSPTK